MFKKKVSNPIVYQYRTEHPQTRKLEFVLHFAEEIKNKKISYIQHNKASKAMDYIDKSMAEFITWFKSMKQSKSIDGHELDSIAEQYINLIKEKLAPQSSLGAWFNQEKNTRQRYHELMHDLKITTPEKTKESLIGRIIPQRMEKAVKAIFETTQTYRERASSIRSDKSDAPTVASDESTPKRR